MIYWHAEALDVTKLAAYENLLTTEEALVFARLRHVERRAEWVLGRSVAKQLVQRYLVDKEGVAPDDCAISILPDAAGAPYVEMDGARLDVVLSISHSDGTAFCALVGEAGVRVGVDIEGIAPRDEQFLCDFFSVEERAFMAGVAADGRDTIVTAIWCGKEAYFKALGTGLSLAMRTVTCLPTLGAADDWLPMKIEGTLQGEWQGSWRVWGNFVLMVITG